MTSVLTKGVFSMSKQISHQPIKSQNNCTSERMIPNVSNIFENVKIFNVIMY